jgi:hypothetical protein
MLMAPIQTSADRDLFPALVLRVLSVGKAAAGPKDAMQNAVPLVCHPLAKACRIPLSGMPIFIRSTV